MSAVGGERPHVDSAVDDGNAHGAVHGDAGHGRAFRIDFRDECTCPWGPGIRQQVHIGIDIRRAQADTAEPASVERWLCSVQSSGSRRLNGSKEPDAT
jgi:hypothetical protein